MTEKNRTDFSGEEVSGQLSLQDPVWAVGFSNPGGRTQRQAPRHLTRHRGTTRGNGTPDLECARLGIRWRAPKHFLSTPLTYARWLIFGVHLARLWASAAWSNTHLEVAVKVLFR